MKALLLIGMMASTLSATAQAVSAPAFTTTCQSGSWVGQSESFCETRDLTLPAPAAGQVFTIDGGHNGGITVQGWDGADVRVRAKVQTWGGTQADAQARAQAIRVGTAGNTLRATAPGDLEHASVSFEVFVPRRQALAVNTHNGGIRLSGLQASVTFRAQNGGVTLADLGGHVAGQAVNGSLSITLSGRQWEGEGLDVATTNGSISWHLPADYSARFTTSTDNGSLRTLLPVSKSPGSRRAVDTTLGQGGQPVQAVTTNGGIVIKQG